MDARLDIAGTDSRTLNSIVPAIDPASIDKSVLALTHTIIKNNALKISGKTAIEDVLFKKFNYLKIISHYFLPIQHQTLQISKSTLNNIFFNFLLFISC